MKTPMHRIGPISAVLLVFLACCTLSAAAAPIIHREVTLSDGVATITYTVDAEHPFALGIVESVPEGWTFPDTESAVSTAPYFEIDRTARKIAFFVCNDVRAASYTLTGAGDGVEGFVTEWVDLCELSPSPREGREGWRVLGAESAASPVSPGSHRQGVASAQEAPGFGISAALSGCIVGACAVLRRHRIGGDST